MYQTQHVIGTSQHQIIHLVRDLVGLTPLGLALRVSVILENFTTQFNLFRKHESFYKQRFVI
jgi:hypothetical protein